MDILLLQLRLNGSPPPADSIARKRKSTMTVQVSDANSTRRLSLSQKLAVASGAAAAFTGVAAPQLAEAGIVPSTTVPASPPSSSNSSDTWDVDGDGTPDFNLRRQTSSASVTELGATRFVFASAEVGRKCFAKLSAGFTVGATMPGLFTFFSDINKSITITKWNDIGMDAGVNGWANGDIGYFGFKFSNTSGIHYGWGQIDIKSTGSFSYVGQGYTFTEAYYNTTPDASIKVGDTGAASVPEIDPASAASVLSLVMGSLAMLERRRLRRSKKVASDATVSA